MRLRRPAASELFPDLVDVLLLGWKGHGSRTDGSDPFRVFDYSESDLVALWHRHRSELLSEWQRRDGQGEPWIEAREAELRRWGQPR